MRFLQSALVGGATHEETKHSYHAGRPKRDNGVPQGDQVGDSYDFDTERGKLCPMAMHVAFPYVDILRYGGKLPSQPDGTFLFCCPDVDVINVFQLTVEDEGDGAASV